MQFNIFFIFLIEIQNTAIEIFILMLGMFGIGIGIEILRFNQMRALIEFEDMHFINYSIKNKIIHI